MLKRVVLSSEQPKHRKFQDIRPPVVKVEEPQDEEVFEQLDQVRAKGQGSCCSLWSFYLLFGTLLVLGLIIIFRLIRG